MPSNLLLFVPLVAGYLFYNIFYYTRYRSQSLDGYKLVFQAAIYGFAFFAFARLWITLIKLTQWGKGLWVFWNLYGSRVEFSGTGALSIALSVVIAGLLNVPIWEVWRRAFRRRRLIAKLRQRLVRVSSREFIYAHTAIWNPNVWVELYAIWEMKRRMALMWATRRQKNQLLVLLSEAVSHRRMVSISLTNRKFYIGFIKTSPSLNPSETYFRIYLIASGYRDKDTLRFEKTTDYEPVTDAISGDPVFVTIPLANVEVANFFDPGTYEAYFSRPKTAEASGSVWPC